MFLPVTLLQPQGLRNTLSVTHSLLHHLPHGCNLGRIHPNRMREFRNHLRNVSLRWDLQTVYTGTCNTLLYIPCLDWSPFMWGTEGPGSREPVSPNGREPLPCAAKCMQRARWFRSHFPKRKFLGRSQQYGATSSDWGKSNLSLIIALCP